uniref:Rhodanese domain-containing protein n=1 Tax=Populus alba TaxID=43335 RepID=A0A4V6A9L5_POPAL|nr:hypothetical protein D5086_0000128620 [Populus alba]
MKVLRERDGIPDLRRAARFRYASVTLPKDRYKVIVMDADGSYSIGIARSLRKFRVKRPYLVQGGFHSWVKQGIQAKELKPETVLTILNEAIGIVYVSKHDGAQIYEMKLCTVSRHLLSPVRLGVQAFSWAAGKLENNRIGLPTSPSPSDVQNRVLQAATKHESQPSETEVPIHHLNQ